MNINLHQQFRHNANAALLKGDMEHKSLPHIKKMFAQKMDDIMNFETRFNKSEESEDSSKSSKDKDSQVEFWHQSRLALIQSIGIRDGFNVRRAKTEPEMTLVDMMVMSSDGETPELQVAYDDEEVELRESEADTGI